MQAGVVRQKYSNSAAFHQSMEQWKAYFAQLCCFRYCMFCANARANAEPITICDGNKPAKSLFPSRRMHRGTQDHRASKASQGSQAYRGTLPLMGIQAMTD